MISTDMLGSIAAGVATATETIITVIAAPTIDTSRGTLVTAISMAAVVTAYIGVRALLEYGWLDRAPHAKHRPRANRIDDGLYQTSTQHPGTIYRTTTTTALGETR